MQDLEKQVKNVKLSNEKLGRAPEEVRLIYALLNHEDLDLKEISVLLAFEPNKVRRLCSYIIELEDYPEQMS